MPGGQVRRPLGPTSLATASDAIGATYAIYGVAVDIEGMGDLSIEIKELGTGGSNGIIVRAHVVSEYDAAAPTAIANLPIVSNADGTDLELVVAQDEERKFALGTISGKWLLLSCKHGASGDTNETATAKVNGNVQST